MDKFKASIAIQAPYELIVLHKTEDSQTIKLLFYGKISVISP